MTSPTLYTAYRFARTGYRHVRVGYAHRAASVALDVARRQMRSYDEAVARYEETDRHDDRVAVSKAAAQAGAYSDLSMRPQFSSFNELGPTGSGWCEASGLQHLRRIGYADELTRLSHNGWFADAHEDAVYRGVVYLLPSRNGHRHYLVGYADPHNDGCAYLEHLVTEEVDDYENDHRTAAREADRIAEREAEQAREYDYVWQDISWLTQKAEQVCDAAQGMGEAIVEMRDSRRNRQRGLARALLHAAKSARDDLRDTLVEFVEANTEALDKFYNDPLDHDAAADHDTDLVRRARALAEMVEAAA